MGNKQDKDAIALKGVSDEDASDASDVSDEQASDEDVSDEDDAYVSDEDASDEDEYMSLDASELQDVPDEAAGLKDVPGEEDVLEDVVGLNDVPDKDVQEDALEDALALAMGDALDLVYAKLELKDIAACRGVCKSMRNFIDNPRFVRFWNRQQHGPETLIYVGSPNEKCQAVGDPKQGWHRHLKLENTGCMKLISTTHALMCFLEGKRQLVVVNPLTGQARKLPLWGTETYGEMVSAGIHFDRSAGEYTVVGAMTDNRSTKQILCTAMYSSATGSWSQLESMRSTSSLFPIHKPIVWFKGDFYWTIGESYKKQMIVRLDESSYRWIPMSGATINLFDNLFVVNHCLLLGNSWLVDVKDRKDACIRRTPGRYDLPDGSSYVVCYIDPQIRKTVFQMTSRNHECCIPNEEDLFTTVYTSPPKYCSDSGPKFFEFSAGLGI